MGAFYPCLGDGGRCQLPCPRPRARRLARDRQAAVARGQSGAARRPRSAPARFAAPDVRLVRAPRHRPPGRRPLAPPRASLRRPAAAGGGSKRAC